MRCCQRLPTLSLPPISTPTLPTPLILMPRLYQHQHLPTRIATMPRHHVGSADVARVNVHLCFGSRLRCSAEHVTYHERHYTHSAVPAPPRPRGCAASLGRGWDTCQCFARICTFSCRRRHCTSRRRNERPACHVQVSAPVDAHNLPSSICSSVRGGKLCVRA